MPEDKVVAAPTHPPVVETRNLTKVYADGPTVHALRDVNLVIRPGEFVAVMGPSGSGKSTLLHILGGLDRATSGEVLVNGEDLSRVKNLDRFRARTVGFVFQLHNLIPTLTAVENVELPMYWSGLSASQRRARAEALLEQVGLGGRRWHLPAQLSGGERQRVAIARALANDPAIVLADEPTGNLDSQATAEIMALLRRLNREHGKVFIVVTHNPDVAYSADRIITLRDGQIIRDEPVGSPYLRALRELRDSALGRELLAGRVPPGVFPEDLQDLARGLAELLRRMG